MIPLCRIVINPLRRLTATGLVVVLLFAAGCDSGGDSGPSGEAPSVPTGIDAVQQGAAVDVTWKASNRADGYNVYRARGDAEVNVSGTPVNGESSISDTQFSDSSVQSGTVYSYRVTAVGAGGAESNPSASIQIRVFADPPARP